MTGDRTRYDEGMLIVASGPLKSSKQPSRYKRLAIPQDKIPRSFRVTDLVLEILSALAAHRYFSTNQIIRLAGGSPRYIQELLRLLHRHGLVERPVGQAAYLSAFYHEGNV